MLYLVSISLLLQVHNDLRPPTLESGIRPTSKKFIPSSDSKAQRDGPLGDRVVWGMLYWGNELLEE